MNIQKTILLMTIAALLVLPVLPAAAKVSKEEAERLKGGDLTPLGAERAGNADGTIPAWDGGMTAPPPGVSVKPGDFLPDPFKDEKPRLTITAANMDQYADQLTEGTRWMLQRYPDTFRVDVYPTHRTMAAPQWVYDNTYTNALKAEMDDARLGIKNAYGGIPFPIPSLAEEVVYNHFCRWQGASRLSGFTGYMVQANGSLTATGGGTSAENYPYYYPGEPNYDTDIWRLFIENTEPARRKGEMTLLIDSVNPQYNPRKAWQYLPGQRRVRRAPTLAYDNPNPDSAITVYDEAWMFNGAIDRYDWKLIGKQEMFIPYNNFAHHLAPIEEFAKPYHWNPDLARWELHRVWVVEATLKEGARHQYGRRVFYFDEDSWILSMKDHYDNRGDFWRFTFGMNYPDYGSEVPSLVSTPWVSWDVTVPFWYISAAYQKYHMPITRNTDINPEEWYSATYLRQAGRR